MCEQVSNNKIYNKTLNNKFMSSSSALLPSPLLSPLSALTSAQQKILNGHSTHLNMQKYKKGKTLYLAFIQAKSSPNSQRYNQFLQQFTSKNYVSKMLLISAMKYYRDIKQILIGGPADAGIQQDRRFKYIEIDAVLKELDSYAQLDQQTERLMNNTQKAEKDLAVSIQLRKQQQLSKQTKAQQKFSRSNQSNAQDGRTKSTLLNQKNNAKPALRVLAKTLTYDSQVEQITPVTYNAVPHNSPCQYSRSEKSEQTSNELQYIKLIQVKMENKNIPSSTKSVKMHSNYNDSTVSNQGSYTHRVGQGNRFLSNLGQNNLYQKRQTSLSTKGKSKSELQIPSKPNTYNKYHKNIKKKTPLGSGICDKLLQCLRYLGIIAANSSQNKQPTKTGHDEQKKPLISSKVSTKSQITNATKKNNTK